MHCEICVGEDGVMTRATTETLVANEKTGVKFFAFVCERCLTLGRITRVTCRTFKK